VSVLNFHEEERQKPENWTLMITMSPSVQDRATNLTRLRKFGFFMAAFSTFRATGIIKVIKPNQRRTLFGVIQTRVFLGGWMGDQLVTAYLLNNSKYI
jgi:hypothetical protein